MIDQNAKAKAFVIKNIARDMADFGISDLELQERISIKLDVEQFNYKEDESVWKQKRGKAAQVCEVYFDDVWCCDLKDVDIQATLVYKFFKGFNKGYESGKIRLNRWLALIADEQQLAELNQYKADQKAKIDSLPTSTPEEKMAKDIIKEIAKEKDVKTTVTPTNDTTTI